MSEEHECDDPSTCPVCSPKVKAPKTKVSHGAPFLAKFGGGQCPDCNLPIYQGDKVCYRYFGYGNDRTLVHKACAS